MLFPFSELIPLDLPSTHLKSLHLNHVSRECNLINQLAQHYDKLMDVIETINKCYSIQVKLNKIRNGFFNWK